MQPLVKAVGSLVHSQGGGRLLRDAKAVGSTIERHTGVVLTLVSAPHGSYAITMTLDSGEQFTTLDPALYDCLKIASGHASRAKRIGLFVPDFDQPAPAYSPALGFYRVLP